MQPNRQESQAVFAQLWVGGRRELIQIITPRNATYTNTFLYGPIRPLKLRFSGTDAVHSIVSGHDYLGGDMIKNYLQRTG